MYFIKAANGYENMPFTHMITVIAMNKTTDPQPTYSSIQLKRVNSETAMTLRMIGYTVYPHLSDVIDHLGTDPRNDYANISIIKVKNAHVYYNK